MTLVCGQAARRGVGGDVGEPGAGLALGFGDLARGHVLGDVGAAFLRQPLPLRAARLNHLCASTKSISTPPVPVE